MMSEDQIGHDNAGPADLSPQGWLDWTSEKQSLASDPGRSAWVSANAGSGKTHVLTQRVIRLLLAGCRPSAILCLTYTKAAASEMSNRVFERLGEWVTLDDEALSQRIQAIEGKEPDRIKLMEARRLFARALETPGGLKIQTIHAFCEALLHQFPLEANVAGHFSVLDDRASATLLADARRALLTATASEDDADLTQAFETVLDLADDTGLEKLLAAIVASRTPIKAFLDGAAAHGGIAPALRAALGIGAGETADSIMHAIWPLAGLGGDMLERYIGIALDAGGVKVQAVAEGLKSAARMPPGPVRFAAIEDIFMTGTGKPRADSSFVSKAMRDRAPDLDLAIQTARAHVEALRDRLNLLRMFEATHAALVLANRLNDDYDDLKRVRSQLDFDDLINHAAALFARGDVSAWIHYKLDQGIDHILVDEAQDTSPVQWSIIQSLAGEFFSGSSARETNRTMFAVGDEKQSIYSFQGARPERFSNENLETAQRVRESGKAFSDIRLQLSFRSTEDVLSAVDTVFADPGHARGLSARHEAVIHASNRVGHAGLVEVWEPIAPEQSVQDEEWTAAFDATPETAPVNILAQRVAAVLSGWIGRETVMEKGIRRPMRPGDVIVLVRKRDAFVNALTRALKKRGNIPVAGADRLVLTRHIAVQDLMALGRFVLLPRDDLSLAAVLKSPLFDLSEEDLFTLAGERPDGESLWDRMRGIARDDETHAYAGAVTLLSRYRLSAQSLSVHDFYARILGFHGGRAAFLGRLGSEVSDILDEFLTFALDHEKNGLPGLQAFISGLEIEAPTVKREQDKERNEVRIMTVHAAKGLEAPVVFLVDGGGKAFNAQQMPGLRFLRQEGAFADEAPVPLWRPPGATSNSLIDADTARLKVLAEEEYRRLLYVGMTRAADRLIVCGYQGKRVNEESWHAMVTASLSTDQQARGVQQSFSAGGQEWQGLSWRSGNAVRDVETRTDTTETTTGRGSLPEALSKPLPAQRRLPRPLSPSGAGVIVNDEESEPVAGARLFAPVSAPNASLLRGAILHRFLQILPMMPAGERRAAAERYLERSVPQWSAEQCDAFIRSVLDVIDHEELTALFSPRSRAEVSIMGTLSLGGRDFAISGRIDRLAVEDDRVIIADFKTNRDVPASAAEVPHVYKAQLALYRAILAPLYPRHRIECALIYTEGPSILALPSAMLDESLDTLATK